LKELTKIEEILGVSFWRLKDQAYGVKIRQHVLLSTETRIREDRASASAQNRALVCESG
jgi:hypothetical protein